MIFYVKEYKNGERYEGYFKNGKREGHGTYEFANGNKYTGIWKDCNQEDQDTHEFASAPYIGDKYIGMWKDDKKEGHGTYEFANGNKYTGMWKDGKQEGQGTYEFANGNKYTGMWKDGKRDGHATHEFANGNKYTGMWKDGKQEVQDSKFDILCKTLSVLLFPEKFESLTTYLKSNPRLMEFSEHRSNDAILVMIDANKNIDLTSNLQKLPLLNKYNRIVLIVNINNQINYTSIDVNNPFISLYSNLNIFWKNYIEQIELETVRLRGQVNLNTFIKYLYSYLYINEIDGEPDLTQVNSIVKIKDEITFWNNLTDQYPDNNVYYDINAQFNFYKDRSKESIEDIDKTFELLYNLNVQSERYYPKVRKIALIHSYSHYLIQKIYFNLSNKPKNFSINSIESSNEDLNWFCNPTYDKASEEIINLVKIIFHFEDNLTKYLLSVYLNREDINLTSFDKMKKRVLEIQEIRSKYDYISNLIIDNTEDKLEISTYLRDFNKIKYLNTADLYKEYDLTKKIFENKIDYYNKKYAQINKTN